MSKNSIKSYGRKLESDGIVVISEFWSDKKCIDKRTKIEKLIDDGDIKTADDSMGYKDLANFGGPIISERKGKRDDGMLDIFNMDLAISELSDHKNNDFIIEVINAATNDTYKSSNLNVYFNKSVTNTRGYHADSYSGQFKSFLYLTDVPDDSYGPFGYIKGSHNPSRLQRKMRSIINKKILNKPPTNAIFPLKYKEVKCTAPKGTLIIANQAGLHRGTPQEEGKERVLISTSYSPF